MEIVFIVSLVLLVLERLTQTRWCLLWAMAAATVGFIAWLFSLDPSANALSLSVLLLGAVFSGLHYHSRRYPDPASIRPKTLIGQTATLTRPIRHGKGQLTLHRLIWPVECAEHLPKRTVVRIKKVNGVILTVEKA